MSPVSKAGSRPSGASIATQTASPSASSAGRSTQKKRPSSRFRVTTSDSAFASSLKTPAWYSSPPARTSRRTPTSRLLVVKERGCRTKSAPDFVCGRRTVVPLAARANPSRRHSRGAQSGSHEVDCGGRLNVLFDRHNAVCLCDSLHVLGHSGPPPWGTSASTRRGSTLPMRGERSAHSRRQPCLRRRASHRESSANVGAAR